MSFKAWGRSLNMGFLASDHGGGAGKWILSIAHQKPLECLGLGVKEHCPPHRPKPESFIPNCSGPKVTESPTSLTLRNSASAVVVDSRSLPRAAVSAEALNPDLPRASETLPEALVCPTSHQQLRPCQPQFLAAPHTLLWPSHRAPGI